MHAGIMAIWCAVVLTAQPSRAVAVALRDAITAWPTLATTVTPEAGVPICNVTQAWLPGFTDCACAVCGRVLARKDILYEFDEGNSCVVVFTFRNVERCVD
nr:unnamed protein product [Digitaria exilis]